MYRIFKEVILLGESCASKCTNLGISDAFSMDALAFLSKERL